jgi:Domain of unknown function (DUF4365)
MTETRSRSELVGRRGELFVELFLQDLEPEFLARPSTDFGYDLFAGFRNPRGGINIIAVEVKSTEKTNCDRFPVKKTLYSRWAHSNIPVLFLVANVKYNKLFYHWPSPDSIPESQELNTVAIQLTEINEKNKEGLRTRLTG